MTAMTRATISLTCNTRLGSLTAYRTPGAPALAAYGISVRKTVRGALAHGTQIAAHRAAFIVKGYFVALTILPCPYRVDRQSYLLFPQEIFARSRDAVVPFPGSGDSFCQVCRVRGDTESDDTLVYVTCVGQ